MNKQTWIVALAAISIATIPIVKAFDPASIVVGALVVAGVNKAVDGLIYLFSPSQSDKDHAARHERLRFFTKKNFVDDIEFARSASNKDALDFITQHELYKYPSFIEAIKESFPEYAEYIKKLMRVLDNDPKARLVRGFETDHVYHKCKGIFKKDARDFSEFYELIKKLYAEVIAQEQQLPAVDIIETAQINAPESDLPQSAPNMDETNHE